MIYRTGLQTLPFLLDVLNQIAGYDQLFNLPRQSEAYTEQDLMQNEQKLARQLYEKQMEDFRSNKPNNSNHPHIVIAIHGCDNLWYLECSRGRQLLESLFLRLYNPYGYRKHFPIFLEFSKPQFYFVHHIPHFHYQMDYSFPMLELFRVKFKDLDKQIMKVLPAHNLPQVQTVLGNNAFFYHALYEDLMTLYSEENEAKVLQPNGHFKKPLLDLIDQLPTLRKIKTQFHHRIVNFITHPLLGDQLDQGTAKWQAIYLLRAFSKRPNMKIIAFYKRKSHWLEQPFLTAANEEGLCFASRYFENWRLQETLHQFLAHNYYFDERRKMSFRERLAFIYYKKFTVFNFGKPLDSIRMLRRFEKGEFTNVFHSETWQFAEIYYGEGATPNRLNEPITFGP